MKTFYSKYIKATKDVGDGRTKDQTDQLSVTYLPKVIDPFELKDQPAENKPGQQTGDNLFKEDLDVHLNEPGEGYGKATKPSELPTEDHDHQQDIVTQTTLDPTWSAVTSKSVGELQKELDKKIQDAIEFENEPSLDSFLLEFKKDIPSDPIKYLSLNTPIDNWIKELQKQKDNKEISAEKADGMISKLLSLKDEIKTGRGAKSKGVQEFTEQISTGVPALVEQAKEYEELVNSMDEFSKKKLDEISSKNTELTGQIKDIKSNLTSKAEQLSKSSNEFQQFLDKNQEINLKLKDLELEKIKLMTEKVSLSDQTKKVIQEKYPSLDIFEDKRKLKDDLMTELVSNLKTAFRLAAKHNMMVTQSNDNFIYSFINYPDNSFRTAAISHLDKMQALLSTLKDPEIEESDRNANAKKLEQSAEVFEKFMVDGAEKHEDYVDSIKKYIEMGENLVHLSRKFSEMMSNIESGVFNNFNMLSNTYIALQKDNLRQLEELSFEKAKETKEQNLPTVTEKKSSASDSFNRQAVDLNSIIKNIKDTYNTVIDWLSETKDYLFNLISELFNDYNSEIDSINTDMKSLEKELLSSDFYKLATLEPKDIQK